MRTTAARCWISRCPNADRPSGANAFLRPVRAEAISAEAQKKFLPASEYARAGTVDYVKMSVAQRGFSERYAKEVN